MRYPICALLILLLAACAGTKGPGSDCDPCATAEANPVGIANQAAAAAASGGQKAHQAPFAEDTARLAPQTTIGRGEGATTSNSADEETREVASGGAQNLSVTGPPTQAAASTGGGIPLAALEAGKTVASLRAMLQLALTDPTCPLDKIEFISGQLTMAQETLSLAQASASTSHVTHYHFENSRNTQVGLSTSKTGNQPSMDPEVVAGLAEATARTVEAGTVEYEDAPVAPETPEEPTP